MQTQFNCEEVEKKLQVKFNNKKLLKTAFTHSSYANEHNAQSNERLEFLGDSVLGLVVTEKIFSTTHLAEGQLSKLRSLLVSAEPLSRVIDSLDVEKYMIKGKGESKSKIDSKPMKCDLFEAIVGAIYLDNGYCRAQEFILEKLKPIFCEVWGKDSFEDSKSQLQEKFSHQKVVYKTKKSGQDHNPQYNSVVYLNGVACGSGVAGNKRTAEQMAATQALKSLTKE